MDQNAPYSNHRESKTQKVKMSGLPWFRLLLMAFVLGLFGWGALTGRINLERGQATLAHTDTIRLIQAEVAFSQKLLAHLDDLRTSGAEISMDSIAIALGGRKQSNEYLSHPWSIQGIQLQTTTDHKNKFQIVYKNLPSDICHRFVWIYTSQRHPVWVNNHPLRTDWDRSISSTTCESEVNEIVIQSLESWTSTGGL